MSDKTAFEGEAEGAPSMRTVVVASSAGTAFEWYDFFIFGALASIISRNFFAGLTETAGLVAALALFGAGFAFRPLGALIFGRMGDLVGRKAAFLVPVTLMGGATLALGFLPTYAQAGLVGPALLILLRILQGLALGGEYGGAAIYVAEHAPAHRRGEHTSWIQASAAFGLIGALAVILVTRRILGEEAFADWGWRVPFLLSAGLLAVSIFMRLKLAESPSFARLKAAGEQTKAPFAEAFGRWPNLKIVLLVLFAFMSAQGAVWYTTFFYVQIFLERFLKVEPATVNTLMICATLASAGLAATPVVVFADPADCALQFDPIGRTQFASACDIAKTSLANAGVSYENLAARAGAGAEVRIGQTVVVSADGSRLDAAGLKTVRAQVDGQIRQALADNGYPAVADPARTNLPAVFGILMIFVVAATALYGPMAAALVELFPTRIRYTAMSLPYHIGTGWVGGFVPFSAFAIVTATGNIYSGLWYPVIFTAISVVVCLFLPETKGKPLD